MTEYYGKDWPIPRDILEKHVKYAIKLPSLKEAMFIIEFLEVEFRGCFNQEAFDMIDSIKKHFKEDSLKAQEEKIKEQIKKEVEETVKKYLDLPELIVEDEQIEKAIYLTAPDMTSHRDWGGIYRVLVDLASWPDRYADFERKVERLNLSNLPEKISFNYQGLQNGLPQNCPKKYYKWKTFEGDDTFKQRRKVADTFYNHLKEIAESTDTAINKQ